MGYGFQAFSFEIAKGPAGYKGLDVADPLGDGRPAKERVHQALSRLLDRVVLGMPGIKTAAEWQQPDETAVKSRGEPSLLVQGWSTIAGGWTLIDFQYGLVGEFDQAISRTERRIMMQSAASSRFRALICLPSSGTMGRLAVESVGTRCPAPMLVNWLGRVEYEEDPTSCCRFIAHQIVDRQMIKDMATAANKVGIRLRNTQSQRKLLLELEADSLTMKTGIIEAARNMADGRPNSVHEVEALADLDPGELQQASLTFDHADLLIDDKVLNPDRIRAKFSYPLSKDIPLEDVAWAEAVVSALKHRLSEGTDIFP